MRIDLICSDFSKHRVARTYCVAQVLSMDHEVRLWGWTRNGDLWAPLKDTLRDATVWELDRLPAGVQSMQKMAAMMEGDVLYCFKPLAPSFGLGLMAKCLKDRPLILDIDDWEPAFSEGLADVLLRSLRHGTRMNTPAWIWLMDRCVKRADAITTVSRFLQEKYGGEILPHGRDHLVWDPGRFSKEEERKRLGLGDLPLAVFLGTPRAHKGIEDLVDAILLCRKDRLMQCLLVGGDVEDRFVASLMERAQGALRVEPMCPYEELPRFLSVADMVVLPQRDDPRAYGQVPAKLYDAMAMARPIVSTRISEIPRILEGCGLLVEPGDVPGMAQAMRQLIDDPRLASELGRKAREKSIQEYSHEAMRGILSKVLEKLVGAAPCGRPHQKEKSHHAQNQHRLHPDR